jgi:hypothetical protein
MNFKLATMFLTFLAVVSTNAEDKKPTPADDKKPAALCVAAQAQMAFQATECSNCTNNADYTRYLAECKGGSVRSCYLAAAALCQCNLDAGGCGSSTDALRTCVEQNRKQAQDLGGN